MRFPTHRPARIVYLFLPAALVAGWLHFSDFSHSTGVAAATGDADQRQPVLVELFTSEGCSSCPPADALLARLDATQFVAGAEAIVLSEHVTYWNDLGWRDPFSMDAMTERQRQYASRFGLDSVYTPQAVIDGTTDVVGSDSTALSRAVARAAVKPKAELVIENAQWTGDAIHFTVRSAARFQGRLMAALAEDETHSSVARGENAGRTLHHVAVVRVLQTMSEGGADGRLLTLQLPTQGSSIGQNAGLRMVVFLADHTSGRILAVAEREITR